MSAGLEFVGVDGWGRLPGRYGSAPHVLFETGGGKDKDQVDAVGTDVFETYPGLSRKENRASGMYIVFLGAQGDVCGALWTSRISSCSRCLCRGIFPPGGMSSVPSTRCFEPLFCGVTFRMNSAVGMGSDPSGRRTRASPSFFSSTRVLAPSDCAAQITVERATTTSGIIRFMLRSLYCDASSVNERDNFDHVSRLPSENRTNDKWRNIPINYTNNRGPGRIPAGLSQAGQATDDRLGQRL